MALKMKRNFGFCLVHFMRTQSKRHWTAHLQLRLLWLYDVSGFHHDERRVHEHPQSCIKGQLFTRANTSLQKRTHLLACHCQTHVPVTTLKCCIHCLHNMCMNLMSNTQFVLCVFVPHAHTHTAVRVWEQSNSCTTQPVWILFSCASAPMYQWFLPSAPIKPH